MNPWKNLAIAVGILIIGAPIAIAAFIMYETSDMCGNEVYSEVLSPDNQLKAVVFQRDCGATTGFSTQISIIGANDNLENESGNIYIINGHPKRVAPRIQWLSNTELNIGKSINGSEFKAEKYWGFFSKIKVSYGTVQ